MDAKDKKMLLDELLKQHEQDNLRCARGVMWGTFIMGFVYAVLAIIYHWG